MALQTKAEFPGGFTSDTAYRVVHEIRILPTQKSLTVVTVDYKDQAERHRNPAAAFNATVHGLSVSPQEDGEEVVGRDPVTKKIQTRAVQSAPSYDQFLSQALTTYLPTGADPTKLTVGDVLGAIGYGYAKTRTANQGATDA